MTRENVSDFRRLTKYYPIQAKWRVIVTANEMERYNDKT